MRALAFALMPQLISLFELLPLIGPLFGLASVVLWLYATWVAMQEALGLRRVTAALVPLVGLLVFIGASIAVGVLFSGLELTIETLLMHLGFTF
jgi:hypothetical protein